MLLRPLTGQHVLRTQRNSSDRIKRNRIFTKILNGWADQRSQNAAACTSSRFKTKGVDDRCGRAMGGFPLRGECVAEPALRCVCHLVLACPFLPCVPLVRLLETQRAAALIAAWRGRGVRPPPRACVSSSLPPRFPSLSVVGVCAGRGRAADARARSRASSGHSGRAHFCLHATQQIAMTHSDASTIAFDSATAPAASLFSAAWFATCELLLVALLWGTTNPCINKATHTKQNKSKKEDGDTQTAAAADDTPGIASLLLNWRFLLPFALNQLGSVVYLHCLSQLSLSFAVPTVNALTMLTTAAAAHHLGERTRCNTKVAAGMMLMLAGICLCILSQHKE